MTRPLVIAHRGDSGHELENSLAAFRAAVARGADAVELDIHSTADGEIVVHHDEQLKDGRHLSRSTMPDLLSTHLANGEPIPTLEQALATIGEKLSVFVELKTLPAAADTRLLAVLAGGPNPAGYAIHSFDHRIVKRVGQQQPKLRRGVLSCSYPLRPVAAMEETAAQDLWQDQSLIDVELAKLVHSAKGRLIAWTANTAERMRHLLQVGVDALCTNYPDVARRIVDTLNP